MLSQITKEAARLVASCDPDVLARAVRYLYTKETKSSFLIERETVEEKKSERFVRTLQDAKDFDPSSERHYIDLQNMIVGEKRHWATGWRTIQNFVGELRGGYRQFIHYICPRPDDVSTLMQGLMTVSIKDVQTTFDDMLSATRWRTPHDPARPSRGLPPPRRPASPIMGRTPSVPAPPPTIATIATAPFPISSPV